MIPTFFDLRTGKTAKGWDLSVYWWTEGSGACDCNRAQAFGTAVQNQLDQQMRARHLELKPHQGYCYGCKRFIAVGAEGDLEGHALETILAGLNAGYGT